MIFGRSERGKPPVEPVTLKILVAGGFGVGKTTLAYGIQRLLKPPAVIPGGSVTWHDADGSDTDVLALSPGAMTAFRWDKVSMVFQGAMSALNPVATVGAQLADVAGHVGPPLRRSAFRFGWAAFRAAALVQRFTQYPTIRPATSPSPSATRG